MELNVETLEKICDICCSITYDDWRKSTAGTFSEQKHHILNGMFVVMRKAIRQIKQEGSNTNKKETTDIEDKIKL